MNSLLSLHRVPLNRLASTRLSLASNPNTFLGIHFPWSELPSFRRSHRNNDCKHARSEDWSDKKEWAASLGRLTSAHPVLSDRCSATAPLPIDRQLHGLRLTPSHEFRESVRSLPRHP